MRNMSMEAIANLRMKFVDNALENKRNLSLPRNQNVNLF